MFRPQTSLSISLILLAASACSRLPLSLGYGVDDVFDDGSNDGSDAAGSGAAATGAGGSSAGTGSGGATGWDVDDECEQTYLLCLESGELQTVCFDDLTRCDPAAAGYAGSGTGGYAGGTSSGGSAGADPGGAAGTSGEGGAAGTGAAGAAGASTGGYAGTSAEAGAAGTGSGGAPAGTGGFAGGTAGSAGASAGTGSGGAPNGLNACEASYVDCVDAGQDPDVCWMAYTGCESFENAAGAGGSAGAGN